jgi:hypothetical protein
MRPHYHVVTFINGCLNDGDSGPITTKAAARAELRDLTQCYRDTGRTVRAAGKDRYQADIVTIKIEECTKDIADCSDNVAAY